MGKTMTMMNREMKRMVRWATKMFERQMRRHCALINAALGRGGVRRRGAAR